MYVVGQEEVDAIAKVLLSGKVFRYGIGGECKRFEERYAEYLGVKHVLMTSSGTASLTAAMVGVGIGPGDEVLVPSHTYIASAIAVLAAGAIPVVVDIDDSLMMSPEAVEAAIGPRTRAILPVHLWGMVCDMDALQAIAKKHGLLIVEDACQCVGGGYKGHKAGSMGNAGGFSFNYYKNMTTGEGGAVVTNDDEAFQRMGCVIDCCSFYWNGRTDQSSLFVSNGSRASELEGAMLNCQLDRLDGFITAMRSQKKRFIEAMGGILKPVKSNSLNDECGAYAGFFLPTAEQADAFAASFPCMVAGKTGRHVYTEWDPILAGRGAHHPALNPYTMKENAECRKELRKDQFPKSLDLLNRAVLIGMHPCRREAETDKMIQDAVAAAKAVL